METITKTEQLTQNFDEWLFNAIVEKETATRYIILLEMDYQDVVELNLVTEGHRIFWTVSTEMIFDKFDRQMLVDKVESFMWNQENKAS